MKKYLKLTVFVLLFASCSGDGHKAQGEPKVRGVLSNATGKMIYFELLNPDGAAVLDSVVLGDDGNFGFTYTAESGAFYRLRVSNNNFFNFILIPGDEVDITADAGNLAYTYQIKGSEESARLSELNAFYTKTYIASDSLNRRMQIAQSQQDVQTYISAVTALQQVKGMEVDYVKKFIAAKPGVLSSLAAVTKLDPEANFDLYQLVATSLKETMPESPYYKQLAPQLAEMAKLAVGSEAPEISLSTPEGKVLSLSSLRGKVVLIDFWASWCKPCRAENPNVVRIYQKYHDKGFDVLGVSLDKNKESWEQAIQQDGLTWNHISDLGYWNSSVVALYRIQGIPQTYLIDKDGKIIGKNLRGEQLEKKLAEIFGG